VTVRRRLGVGYALFYLLVKSVAAIVFHLLE
jgi:hypothetical protein